MTAKATDAAATPIRMDWRWSGGHGVGLARVPGGSHGAVVAPMGASDVGREGQSPRGGDQRSPASSGGAGVHFPANLAWMISWSSVIFICKKGDIY